MRAIPQAVIDLIKSEEETHLFAYDDGHYPPHPAKIGQRIGGTLTAGTGHTGSDVTAGMVVSEVMDADWMLADLQTAAARLEAMIGAGIVADLTDNQYAALLDFVFNMGAKPEWTIWKRLKAKHYEQVPGELNRFVNWGDPPKRSQDLVDRRNAEVALWDVGGPGTSPMPAPPSSVTRSTATPPTPTDPVPISKSKALIAGAAGAAASAPAVVNQVTQAIQPYAAQSHYVQQMVGVLALVGASCVGLTFFFIWLQKRNAKN